jgi:hypothetical protein
MSAARRSPDGPVERPLPADISDLRARRRGARRRRTLARVDLGLGVVGALVLVIVSPGLAITGLIAVLVLVLCGLSFVAQRFVRRRAGRRRAEHRRYVRPRAQWPPR